MVHEVEPRLEALNFIPPSQDAVFMSITDIHDKSFSLPSISSGTLRFMAIAYVITMSSLWAETAGSPGQLVMIEEPENGIYVGHFKQLMEMVEPKREAGPQFIFTSHAPYFIDLFDRYTDGVFVMKSHETHSEIVKPDPGRLGAVLKDFSLGEAHYRELLA
jgi:predicted ATPase